MGEWVWAEVHGEDEEEVEQIGWMDEVDERRGRRETYYIAAATALPRSFSSPSVC